MFLTRNQELKDAIMKGITFLAADTAFQLFSRDGIIWLATYFVSTRVKLYMDKELTIHS
jgi:hypothetical protein